MFQPVSGRVLIRRIKPKVKSDGGIAIPTAAQEQRDFGTVEAIGAEVREVEVGQTIAFAGYAGVNVNLTDVGGHEEGDYLMLEERDIIGIIK